MIKVYYKKKWYRPLCINFNEDGSVLNVDISEGRFNDVAILGNISFNRELGPGTISLMDLEEIVVDVFGSSIKITSNRSYEALTRNFFAYYARLEGYPSRVIAGHIGYKNHSSIYHALNKIPNDIAQDFMGCASRHEKCTNLILQTKSLG